MITKNANAWIVECDCCKKGNWVDSQYSESDVYTMLENSGYQIKSFFGKKTLKCPRCQQ